MTYGGRRLLVEDDHWWKTTFGGRQLREQDEFLWKTTFVGRRPTEEYDLWWKTIFGGRRPSEDHACCLLRFAAFFLLPRYQNQKSMFWHFHNESCSWYLQIFPVSVSLSFNIFQIFSSQLVSVFTSIKFLSQWTSLLANFYNSISNQNHWSCTL